MSRGRTSARFWCPCCYLAAAKGPFCGFALPDGGCCCRCFPKQIYVTADYATVVHRKTSSRLFTHPLLHPRTQTHLVLLQGSFLLHVRAVFARDNSFDISHRHCRTHRSEDDDDNNNNNNKVHELKCFNLSRLSCRESWGTSPWGLSSRSP